MNNFVDIALKIAAKAHKGQVDKAGKHYIHHPIHVASMMDTDEEKAVALLHDIIEDTCYTKDMLLKAGIPQNVADAVEIMTHTDGTDYFEYLAQVKTNPLALAVKIQDITHNSDISRIKHPTENDYKRLEKYKKALEYLTEK